jgi:sarcosine oxidase subunit delta
MNTLNCPNCGPRVVDEFRYGGELRDPPPRGERSGLAWTHYLYQRRNRAGLLLEWWYHRGGCRLWFIAERHTLTHVVHWTQEWPIDDRLEDR